MCQMQLTGPYSDRGSKLGFIIADFMILVLASMRFKAALSGINLSLTLGRWSADGASN